MDIRQAVEIVVRTLGMVEVRGVENLDRLLASIKVLEKVRDALNQEGEKKDATD